MGRRGGDGEERWGWGGEVRMGRRCGDGEERWEGGEEEKIRDVGV